MATMMPGSVVQAAEKAMMTNEEHQKAARAAEMVTIEPRYSDQKMQAATWSSNKTLKVRECRVPAVTDENDVIVRMTSSGLCGTDLHLWRGSVPGMKSGFILGHEGMGIVEDVGPAVKTVKKGDRVVASCCIACGNCFFCKKQLFSACDMTNPSAMQEKLLGQRTASLVGLPVLMGGLDGTQAEVFRIPLGDMNILVLSESEAELPDDKAVFLADILPTAWHGTELAQVERGDIVAVWGAGPVGLLTAQCALARGARRVIMVDKVPYRLEKAKKLIPALEIIDSSAGAEAPEKQVLAMCKNEPGGGPDCVIECVGMHYTNSWIHKFEMAVGLETDSPEALNAAFYAVRKGGRVAAMGAYAGLANHFNIGAVMEKGINVASGPIPVQRYWRDLLEKIRRKELDPSIIITHHIPLDEAADAYKMFDEKADDVIKVIFTPPRRTGATGSNMSPGKQAD